MVNSAAPATPLNTIPVVHTFIGHLTCIACFVRDEFFERAGAFKQMAWINRVLVHRLDLFWCFTGDLLDRDLVVRPSVRQMEYRRGRAEGSGLTRDRRCGC